MALDLDSLMLTNGEFKALSLEIPSGSSDRNLMFEVADAAVAKTLYGIVNWVQGWQYEGGGLGPLYGAGWAAAIDGMTRELKAALEKAGVERPEVRHD